MESKPRAVAAGVSEKDDFFIHTPRKTIAEMIDCRQVILPNDIITIAIFASYTSTCFKSMLMYVYM